MHPAFQKTFGGLSREYYTRQMFFAAIMAGLLIWMSFARGNPGAIIWIVICAFLYPYSRFVYESCVHFVVGDNFFIFPAPVLLIAKMLTMGMCFSFAPIVAPIGLLYLYYYHGKGAA